MTRLSLRNPIALASLATVMGLEHGSEANQPLALAVVGGLTSSTVLSLFLVPVMFPLFVPRERSSPSQAPGGS